MCPPQRATNSEEEHLWAADHGNQHHDEGGARGADGSVYAHGGHLGNISLRHRCQRQTSAEFLWQCLIPLSNEDFKSSTPQAIPPREQRVILHLDGLVGGHHSGQAGAKPGWNGRETKMRPQPFSAFSLPQRHHAGQLLRSRSAQPGVADGHASSSSGHPGLHPSPL